MTTLPKDQLLDFAAKHHLMSLGTIDDNNEPHPVPMYYTTKGGNIFFVSPENTDKYRYMMERPTVYICITDEPHLQSLFIKGEASLATEEDMPLPEILERLSNILHEQTNDLHQTLPLLKHHGGAKKVIKITPTFMRYRDYSGEELVEVQV